jgi:hypothetical protein
MNAFGWLVFSIIVFASLLTAQGIMLMKDSVAAKDAVSCKAILLPQMRDACFSAVGVATLDAGACRMSGSDDELYRCLGVVEGNFTLCSKIRGQDARDFCYYYTVMRTGEGDWCRLVGDEGRRGECEQKAKALPRN